MGKANPGAQGAAGQQTQKEMAQTQADRISHYLRKRIKEARKQEGMTQEELAGHLHKNRVGVCDLERGRVHVSASDIALIAKALNRPVSYFFPPDFAEDQSSPLSPAERELIRLFRKLKGYTVWEEAAIRQMDALAQTVQTLNQAKPQQNVFENP
jgi:transcriptional regulator with XRE-family HTH domain